MVDNHSKTELDTVQASEQAKLLFEDGDHRIYWLGIQAETAFRCNIYLIADSDQYIIVDPGNRQTFQQIKNVVSGIIDPQNITGLILCHQDPDVAASVVDWLNINSEITIFTSPRTRVLLPHYGISKYQFHDIESDPEYELPSGSKLKFIDAPFLHSPMAFTTYDNNSRFLFSGDIYAAIDSDWQLQVQNFELHKEKMDLFHVDYMASNIAARGFVRKLRDVDIEAILPQHGSIIPNQFVGDALEYLNNLQCGLDVLYPDLT